MSINIELRMKDATDFSSQLIYPRAHWQHLDGIPASFNPASHTHSLDDLVAAANDIFRVGHPSTNNEAEVVIDTSNFGSPQIGFREHGDMSWAIGGDDHDNSFKIHGVAGPTIPTIHGLATPFFEIDTGGALYLGGYKVGDQSGKLFYQGTDIHSVFLGVNEKAADADKLDGYNHDQFAKVTPPGEWHHFTDPNPEESGFIDNSWVNRFAFFPTANIEVETSTDGVTFTPTTEYDSILPAVLGGDNPGTISIPNLGTNGSAYKRFTFTPYTYVSLSMLYLWATQVTGTLQVKVEKRWYDTGVWTTVQDFEHIAGWPGHHTLRHGTIWYANGSGRYDRVRLTFYGETTNPSYVNHSIRIIQWWGGYPASKRNVFTIDKDKNADFPANLEAAELYENGGVRVYSPNNKPSLADLGYTGATNANYYVHPDFTETDVDTSGAQVIDTITIVDGHISAVTTRDLTPADIGAAPTHTHPYDNYGGFQFSADGINYTTIGSNEGLDLLFNNLDFNVAGGDSNLGQGNGAGLQISILEERIQDIVGSMFSGNTETRISATYQDADGTIDLVVDDMTYTLTKAAVEAVLTGVIGTHTHNYDNYDHWELAVGGQSGGASREQQSGMLLTLTAGNNIDLYYDDVGNQVYVSFYHEGEVDIASGDHLMIADNSDSNKLKRSDITFGTDDGTFLAKDGNFKSALKKTTLLSTAFSFSTTSVAKTMPSPITGKTIYVSWSLNSDYNECYVSAFQFHSHDNTPVYGFATYYSGYPIQGYNWRLVSTSSTNLSFSTGQSWYITPSGSYTSMGNSTQTIYIKEIYTYD